VTGCVRNEVEVAVVVRYHQAVGFGCRCEDQVGYLLFDTDSGHAIKTTVQTAEIEMAKSDRRA
jgi:hypothetical protein